MVPGGVVSHAWKVRTARAPIAARITSLDVLDRVFIMPSGLAEQSPIYKHKVSNPLCPSGDSLKFAAIAAQTRRNGFRGLFSRAPKSRAARCGSDRLPCGCARIEARLANFSGGLQRLTRRNAPKGSTRELRECTRMFRQIFIRVICLDSLKDFRERRP